MNTIIERLNKIKSNISMLENNNLINVIAVSKTFSLDHIMPLIDHGHIHFGENKVQEAENKWNKIKDKNSKIKLHMIGKLQSNKAKKAVQIFDYIHSVDSQKLADVLSKCQSEQQRSVKYFIQVNVGNEQQKSGVAFNEVDDFFYYCTKEKKMDILGLMAIPPNDSNDDKYFKNLSELNTSLGLKELSMGMSSDYMSAAQNKATFLRIGSLIFGNRI